MGGPPLVSPNRVKVGKSVINDDEDERDTWLVVITPHPGGNIIISSKESAYGEFSFKQLMSWRRN